MGYALRRSRLLVWSWQLCRGMSGNFRVEPVAILPWNQWQFLHGISGNFQMESVATFAWNTHTVEQRFDGAGTRQVEEDTVLRLFDLRRHFEEGEDHGRGLGLSQCGLV